MRLKSFPLKKVLKSKFSIFEVGPNYKPGAKFSMKLQFTGFDIVYDKQTSEKNIRLNNCLYIYNIL